jgi:hypothetical protein
MRGSNLGTLSQLYRMNRLSAVSVDRGTVKIDLFRERNSVLFRATKSIQRSPSFLDWPFYVSSTVCRGHRASRRGPPSAAACAAAGHAMIRELMPYFLGYGKVKCAGPQEPSRHRRAQWAGSSAGWASAVEHDLTENLGPRSASGFKTKPRHTGRPSGYVDGVFRRGQHLNHVEACGSRKTDVARDSESRSRPT